MNLFYSTKILDKRIILEDQEAYHCSTVLRHSEGDHVTVLDGVGYKYYSRISQISKNRITLDVVRKESSPPWSHELPTVAISPVKNASRYEWFFEKATEIGVGRIVPLLCKRSERKKVRMDRLEKIVISAMKQSGRYYKPEIAGLTGIESFLTQNPSKNKWIAHYGEDHNYLQDLLPVHGSTCILIGPEGDFTPDEIARAKAAGYDGVNLSPFRLRTETAGIVACTILNAH